MLRFRPKKPNQKARLFLIISALVIALIAIAYFGIKNLNAPAQGSISQPPASQAETVVPYSQPGRYSGKTVSFNYPAHYKITPAAKQTGYLDVLSLSSSDTPGKQISIAVVSGSLDDSSGVSYRRAHPENYRQMRSQKDVCFIKLDGTEATCYSSQANMTVSVSATSGSNDPTLNDDVQYIMSSLAWR